MRNTVTLPYVCTAVIMGSFVIATFYSYAPPLATLADNVATYLAKIF